MWILYKTVTLQYNVYMSVTMGVAEARSRFSDLFEMADPEPLIVERHGDPIGVVMNIKWYKRLVDLAEEAQDVRAFDASMAEGGSNVAWDQALSDLGWQ
jgi:prevent-host-death family protein